MGLGQVRILHSPFDDPQHSLQGGRSSARQIEECRESYSMRIVEHPEVQWRLEESIRQVEACVVFGTGGLEGTDTATITAGLIYAYRTNQSLIRRQDFYTTLSYKESVLKLG